jgi:hypothetical protein
MNFPTHRKIACCSLALAVAGILCFRCAPTQFVGNGSGTSSITGTVCSSDGRPASGVLVSIIKSDNTPSPSLKKESSSDSLFTSADGTFSIEIKPDVFYNVIAEQGDNKCLRDSIKVLDTTEIANIGKLFLSPAGSLEGRVTLSAGHDPRTVLILVFGTNTFAVPNGSDGAFVLKDMAAGRYAVRFMSTIAGYRSLDTVLAIKAGVIDTIKPAIRLNYVGVQKVSMADASWDSLLLKGEVSWHPVDSTQATIKGYNVYRGIGRGPLTLVASAIADTFFGVDSFFSPTDTFLYFRINAVLSTGDEGKAGLCTLNVSNRAWKKTASMRWPGFPPDYDYYVRFMEAGAGRLFMVNEQTIGILKMQDQSTGYPTIVHPSEFINIKGIAVSSSGFYVANAQCPSLSDTGSLEVFAFALNGDSLGKKFQVTLNGKDCGLLDGLKVIDDNNFYLGWDQRIDRVNGSGALQYSLKLDTAANVYNAVYCAVNDNILFFNSKEYLSKWQGDIISPDCVKRSPIPLPDEKMENFVANRGRNTFFSIEKSGTKNPGEYQYCLSERNLSGIVISRFYVIAEKNLGAMFCCDEKGALYIRDAEQGSIVCYERK